MEASHKTHRPHIKVGKDEEEEEEVMLATSNIVFKSSNHDLGDRKHFKAKHVRFVFRV